MSVAHIPTASHQSYRCPLSTEDWSIGTPSGTTYDKVTQSLNQWFAGPKTPGLIILEHELSNASVSAFINTFPAVKSNGWSIESVVQINGSSAYQNADGDSGSVTHVAGILAFDGSGNTNTNTTSPTTPSPANATSPQPANATVHVTATSPSASSSSSAAPGGNAASQQTSSAPALFVCGVRSVLAWMFTLFVSALALV